MAARVAKLSLTLTGGTRAARKLSAMVQKIGEGKTLKVGFLDQATYPDGTSVATVAFYNEFGTSKIPPRPFIRTMIVEKSPGWGGALKKCITATGADGPAALGLMGEGIKGQLVESINLWADPPNAPSTIAKKGFDKPLISTALMLRSVDYEVSDGA